MFDHILESTRAVRAEAARGRMVRLATGLYAERTAWERLSTWDRYQLQCLAVGRNHVLTGRSAAAVLGLPVWPVPPAIDIAVWSRSKTGRRQQHGLELPVRGHLMATSEAALRSAVMVRRRAQCLDPSLSLMKAASLSTVESGVVTLDGALRQGMAGDELRSAAERAPWCHGLSRSVFALSQATPLSESPGESLSRLRIEELGFAAPLLQQELTLKTGRHIRADFFWPSARLIGEFDGLAKYSLGADTGMSPHQALAEEKRRARDIQRQGYAIVRWTWEDMMHLDILDDILTRAGVPRAR